MAASTNLETTITYMEHDSAIACYAIAPGMFAVATKKCVTVRNCTPDSFGADGFQRFKIHRRVNVSDVSHLALSPDGKSVFAMRANSNVLTLASVANADEPVVQWELEGVPTPIYGLHVAANGVLAVVSYKTAHFFDIVSRSFMHTCDQFDMLKTAMSADGRWFALYTSYDAHLWHLFPSCSAETCGLEQSQRTTHGTFTCEHCGASGPHEIAQGQGLINRKLFEADADDDIRDPCFWTDRMAFLRHRTHVLAITDTRNMRNMDDIHTRNVAVPPNTEYPVWVGANTIAAAVNADVCLLDVSGATAVCTVLVPGGRGSRINELKFEPESKTLCWRTRSRDLHLMKL